MARQRPTRMVMGPCIVEIDCVVIRDVQYKIEVIQCRNEEVHFQGSSANSVREAGGQDGRTDGHHHIIPTFSPKNVVIMMYPTQGSTAQVERILDRPQSLSNLTNIYNSNKFTTMLVSIKWAWKQPCYMYVSC
ncbi:hypothetical protein DPMN_103753 [Dreissena polymorpha]|uniref:Uncharacterized protein n=1 Tax=Dreissena polymorpha TaxID=45954 RepID=A0A9D4K130_DREPO|nr:hypothetical protein DPMN_103753 [Dreissena polymorpha]